MSDSIVCFLFTDEDKEGSGLLTGQHVSVAAATGRAAMCYGGNLLDTVSENSRYASSISVATWFIWQMCFHLPTCTFTVLLRNSKTTAFFANDMLFFFYDFFLFPSCFSDVMHQNVQKKPPKQNKTPLPC